MAKKFNTQIHKIISLFMTIGLVFCFSVCVSSVLAKAPNSISSQNKNWTTIGKKEMLDTVVMVRAMRGGGSGTIIDKIHSQEEESYEYRVLTNAHVTYQRFIKMLSNVDALTGKAKAKIIDTGCWIIIFDQENKISKSIKAKVISESQEYDLAILSFVSKDILQTVNIADDNIIKGIRVLDEVFAVGCQLGSPPSPTVGIISNITEGIHDGQEWSTYGMTSQITPGSSGGGLFKRHKDHYYLIGIPYRIMLARNGQMIPHLAEAISILTATNLINNSSVSN